MNAPWFFCCGWWSPWCLLDVISGCKVRAICDHHDAAMVRHIESRL